MSDAEKFITLLKLERSKNRWRWVALIALVILLMTGLPSWQSVQQQMRGNRTEPYIAKVTVSGLILSDEHATRVLADIANDDQVKALMVNIDSPGGTMSGGLDLYHALRLVALQKPVVATMGTTAASAGYLVALAADRIYANEATLTGSVGVFMPLIDATGLAEKIGVTSDAIVSGELKAVTSPVWQRDAKDRAYLQDVVDRMNTVFYRYVTERRPAMTPEQLSFIQDGRVVVGDQAVELNMVDALGTPSTAKAWLVEENSLDAAIDVVPYKLEEETTWLKTVLEGRLFGKDMQALIRPAVWSLL